MSETTPTAEKKSTSKVNKEPEILILECTIKGDSGFFHEADHSRKRSCPSVLVIPPVSNGWDEEGNVIPIRYVTNNPEIKIEKLKEKGIPTPVDDSGNYRVVGNKIFMTYGTLVVKKNADKGKYNYLEASCFNENAKNRPDHDHSIKYFKVVEPLKEDEDFNDRWLIQNEAESYVASLVQKSNGANKYNTGKIDSLLSLFNQYGGENYAQKLTVLRSMAANNSVDFLKKVKSLDDSMVTLIVHAEELNVISIGNKNAEFVDGNKILANFEGEKLSKDKRIKQLAELLKTPEYASVYQELQAKTDLKEKQVIEN